MSHPAHTGGRTSSSWGSGTKQILFLTATIAPKAGTFLLARADADLRRRDYLEAFRFYADVVRRHPDYLLVMMENSDSDLADFHAIAGMYGISDRTELISYQADDDPGMNRLCLEGALILEALARSRFLQESDARIWKVTGRYIISNIAALVQKQPKQFDLYLNLRSRPTEALDFYVAGFTRNGLEQCIRRIWVRLQGHGTGETVLRQALLDGEFCDLVVVPRLRVVPYIKGRRGFDNRKYNGMTQTVKYWVRVVANAVAPRLWI
ncbi:hypothetical protein [Paracoccus sp. (in: a-proteobacteria)]|uniref:hypothetical protein n=1 Tax=Paracoccus sp. TaxID=267 RepID=UPI0035AE91B7